MPSLGTIIACGAILLSIAGTYGATFYAGMDYGEKKVISKQAVEDNQKLIQAAQVMIASFNQVQEGLKDLDKINDQSAPGPALSYVVERLRPQRKPDRSGPSAPAK